MYTPGRINFNGKLKPAQLQRELDLIAKETQNLRSSLKQDINSVTKEINTVSDAIASVEWDAVTTTIDADDNITQLVYTRNGSTVITEDRTYNAYGHIATQVLTGEVSGTWTHTYNSDNSTWIAVTKS